MDDLLDFTLPVNHGSIIKVLGVGGGGSNAVNYMFNKGIKGVDFIVANTDVQALKNSPVKKKIQLGRSLTEGLGAGNKPDRGRGAAIENLEDIKKMLSDGTKMVFITAGMGGGTGTGAAPVIAEAAKEMEILTVGIVTIPFRYEGEKRIENAVKGIKEMEKNVDALLVINNEKIREAYGNLPISEGFGKADEVLTVAAKGIAEIITVEGYVNVDFADVETVMRDSGVAIMGTGEGEGEDRARIAVEQALDSPLLNNTDITGAKNILVNIVSGEKEVTADELSFINEYVQKMASANKNSEYKADLIWGNSRNNSAGDKLSVTIIATGFDANDIPELQASNVASEKKEEKKEKVIININDDEADNTEKTEAEFEIYPDENEINYKKTDDEIIVRKVPENNEIKKSKTSLENTEQQKSADYLLNIDELENIPAYKRKGIILRNKTIKENDSFSQETLSGNDDEITIKKNNPYLHDKAD